MVRVLIADDSPLVRSVLRDLLGRDAAVELVGEVDNGRRAVEETCRLRPDLVILDVIMPVMDGLDAVVEIMACCPTPILILSANVDPRDSRCAFNAIRFGALDVMEKPRVLGSEGWDEVAARLLEKVHALARVRVMHHFARRTTRRPPPPPPPGQRSILAIGASTGGPKAVLRLLKGLAAEAPLSILIVQHIARGFAAGFAEWLDREVPFAVRLAREGDALRPGTALVAPSDVHLEVHEERVRLRQGPPENCCRPSIDVLFRSLAGSPFAAGVVAVLLTGMGRDGARGMAALREGGGYNIAQDEESCAVFGMPRAAIELGAVHATLPLADIAEAVQRLL